MLAQKLLRLLLLLLFFVVVVVVVVIDVEVSVEESLGDSYTNL